MVVSSISGMNTLISDPIVVGESEAHEAETAEEQQGPLSSTNSLILWTDLL